MKDYLNNLSFGEHLAEEERKLINEGLIKRLKRVAPFFNKYDAAEIVGIDVKKVNELMREEVINFQARSYDETYSRLTDERIQLILDSYDKVPAIQLAAKCEVSAGSVYLIWHGKNPRIMKHPELFDFTHYSKARRAKYDRIVARKGETTYMKDVFLCEPNQD